MLFEIHAHSMWHAAGRLKKGKPSHWLSISISLPALARRALWDPKVQKGTMIVSSWTARRNTRASSLSHSNFDWEGETFRVWVWTQFWQFPISMSASHFLHCNPPDQRVPYCDGVEETGWSQMKLSDVCTSDWWGCRKACDFMGGNDFPRCLICRPCLLWLRSALSFSSYFTLSMSPSGFTADTL